MSEMLAKQCDVRTTAFHCAARLSRLVEQQQQHQNQLWICPSRLPGAEIRAYEHTQAVSTQHYDQYQAERKKAKIWQQHSTSHRKRLHGLDRGRGNDMQLVRSTQCKHGKYLLSTVEYTSDCFTRSAIPTRPTSTRVMLSRHHRRNSGAYVKSEKKS
jgi:hypothetical protein